MRDLIEPKICSEFLVHLHMMNRAFCRQHARIQVKALHLEHAEVRLRVTAYKRLKCLAGNAFRAADGDMRMKGFEIWLESRIQDRVMNASMQCKEMRMPFPYTRPDDRWAAAGVEDTNSAYLQEKRWHPHLAQSVEQPILPRRSHVAKKAERQVKLFLRKPAQAGQMRIEREQRRLAARRKFKANEESFRRSHLQE